MAGARLSTLTRSPPTASTRALRSVVVVTTERAPPPHAGAAASSRTARSAGRRGTDRLLLGEHALGHHAVHALADVHDLGDPAVADHRGEGVRLVPVQRRQLL